jgi:hypothetical protein
MAEHARGRGVLGFMAEIMASNENMIRLARSGKGNVSVAHGRTRVRLGMTCLETARARQR